MLRSDIFVVYDDVQFDKNGWRNRNRIKSPKGPFWLTVPVRLEKFGPLILDVPIDNRQPWARKHVGTIHQYYNRAPYKDRYLPELEDLLLGRHWERLLELDLAIIELMSRWLGIKQELVCSSSLGIGGKRSERLLHFCLHFGTSRYLSGNAAQDYLDLPLFERHGIKVEWQDYRHPVYPQQHGEFVSHLSTLDLLLNCGDKSLAIISGETRT